MKLYTSENRTDCLLFGFSLLFQFEVCCFLVTILKQGKVYIALGCVFSA